MPGRIRVRLQGHLASRSLLRTCSIFGCSPDIGVLLQGLADRETEAPEGDVVRNIGCAHGAEATDENSLSRDTPFR